MGVETREAGGAGREREEGCWGGEETGHKGTVCLRGDWLSDWE